MIGANAEGSQAIHRVPEVRPEARRTVRQQSTRDESPGSRCAGREQAAP